MRNYNQHERVYSMTSKKPKRKSISAKVRFDVFKRDGFECQYCGATPPAVILHVDHITPVAEGGDNSEENLVTACERCNLGKGATPLTKIPESLAKKSERIKEQEAQISGYREVVEARNERRDRDVWSVIDVFDATFSVDSEIVGFRRDWFRSIARFIDLIGVTDVIEAMEIATDTKYSGESKCFKYFCGICWNRIKARGDHA